MADFDTKNEGTWFWFDDNDQDKGGICLRELSTEIYELIEKKTVKTKSKFSHGHRYDEKTVNEKLASEMRWDYCIVDWKNVSIDGVEAECNKENKIRLSRSLNFIKWASPCLEELTETNFLSMEARVKNLETTSDGN